MRPGTHTCLRAACMRVIPSTSIACDDHWLWLPLDVRQAVVDAELYHGQESTEFADALTVACTTLRHGSGS